MTPGTGLAVAGWFIAFAIAATHSANAGAGVIVLGLIVFFVSRR